MVEWYAWYDPMALISDDGLSLYYSINVGCCGLNVCDGEYIVVELSESMLVAVVLMPAIDSTLWL